MMMTKIIHHYRMGCKTDTTVIRTEIIKFVVMVT